MISKEKKMVKITYLTPEGAEQTLEVEPGMSVMEAAVLHGLDGIEAECGGGCSCGTCHVYVEEPWDKTFEEPAPEEEAVIEFLDTAKPTSRLSCQLVLGQEHDGICVRTLSCQEHI